MPETDNTGLAWREVRAHHGFVDFNHHFRPKKRGVGVQTRSDQITAVGPFRFDAWLQKGVSYCLNQAIMQPNQQVQATLDSAPDLRRSRLAERVGNGPTT